MDDHSDIMLDFTTRRPVTPPPLDIINPSSTESSSDGASLASFESPRDWPPQTVDVSLSGQQPDESWKWVDMDFEKLAASTGPSTISPALLDVQGLSFEDAFAQASGIQTDGFPPNDIFALPQLLQTLGSYPAQPESLFAFTQQLLSQASSQPAGQLATFDAPSPPGPSSSSASSVSTDADDLAARVLARTGVTAAIKTENATQLITSESGPMKQSTYRLPKDILSECPPLAKHVQASHESSPGSASPNQPEVIIGASGRPKTSHTTIERRYRTNLNARITALRHAVPALRILERDLFPDDKIDERGYVDGVKAARKSSKASVLGKAAEYIHVLKNRENRLKRELQGLKTLLCSLVGGQALLREWEVNWQERFGGEEMDEAIDGSDGEDEDGSEDEEDKPRKKPKVVKSPTAAAPRPVPSARSSVEAVPVDTGKRKRGRPKKNAGPPSPIGQDTPMINVSPQTPQQTVVPTYLLGTFLFFSFLKSAPIQPASHHTAHEHTGTVLHHAQNATVSHHSAWDSGAVLHYLHAALAVVLVVALLRPVMGAVLGRFSKAKKASIVASVNPSGSEEQLRLARKRLRSSLSLGGVTWESFASVVASSSAESDDGASTLATQLAITEISLGNKLSYFSRLSTITGLYRRLPAQASSKDFSTLALLAHSTSPSMASSLWKQAQKATSAQDPHVAVLRLDISEAHTLFLASIKDGLVTCTDQRAPIDYVTEVLVLENMKSLARFVFNKIVASNMLETPWDDDVIIGDDEAEIKEMAMFISRIGEHLDGDTAELVSYWDRIWSSPDEDLEDDLFDEEESEASLEEGASLVDQVRHLLKSLLLLRSVLSMRSSGTKMTMTSSFTSSSTMTPTQPSRSFASDMVDLKRDTLRLRQMLGSPVFRMDPSMEDARDELIDYLCAGNTQ